jgi:hypothetical protein
MSVGPRRTYWAAIALVMLGLSALALASRRPVFTDLRYAIQRTPELTASSLVLPAAERRRDVPTVSLYVDPSDLYSKEKGILAHKMEHGREWERPGWISFFENGRVTYSGRMGVRVHGGGSRMSALPQSFRLFFRNDYGTPELPAGIAFAGAHSHALERLVIHNDLRIGPGRVRWHFVNPLAYDISQAAGAITPATRPVRFYLNGEFQGVYVLTEHFDRKDHFRTHWGHAVRLDADEFDELWQQIRALEPLTMEKVAPLVDLDNLTRWFITVVFCSTRDPYQGPAQFRDPTRSSAQWFFVNWDMDGSFRAVDADTFEALLEKPGQRRGRRSSEPRPRIMTALLARDPQYQALFKRVWVDIMNHALTPSFLQERYQHYATLARTLGLTGADLEYLPLLQGFLEARPAIVRSQAERWLRTGPSVRVQYTGAGTSIEIDGHRVEPGWEGYYFPGMDVALSVPAGERAVFAGWRINGRERREPELILTATEDLVVELASGNRATQ